MKNARETMRVRTMEEERNAETAREKEEQRGEERKSRKRSYRYNRYTLLLNSYAQD